MSDNNAFGEEGHEAETTTQEMFDRMSKEAYEKYGTMLDKALKGSKTNVIIKKVSWGWDWIPWLILSICTLLLLLIFDLQELENKKHFIELDKQIAVLEAKLDAKVDKVAP